MKRSLILILLILLILSTSCLANENASQDLNVILNNRIDSIHNYFQQKPFLLTVLKQRPDISYIDKGDFTGFYSPNMGLSGIIKIGSTGIEDPRVVYHEYVHALINKIFPQLSNYKTYQAEAIEEGIPQYFACSYLDNPKFNWGKEERTLENDLSYPQNVKFELYNDSYILCGALWGLRDSIKNPMVADFLVYRALYYKPKSFSEMLSALLTVNDEYYGNYDKDLTNDSWSQRITDAFSKHGITMNTPEGIYSASLISKSQKVSFRPGENIVLFAKFQNTGPAVWYNSSNTRRSDNDPIEKREIWLSKIPAKTEFGYTSLIYQSKKIAKLMEEKIKVNDIGTFKIVIKAPLKKGTYKYIFTPQALLTGNDNSPYSPQNYNMNSKVSWDITVN